MLLQPNRYLSLCPDLPIRQKGSRGSTESQQSRLKTRNRRQTRSRTSLVGRGFRVAKSRSATYSCNRVVFTVVPLFPSPASTFPLQTSIYYTLKPRPPQLRHTLYLLIP